ALRRRYAMFGRARKRTADGRSLAVLRRTRTRPGCRSTRCASPAWLQRTLRTRKGSRSCSARSIRTEPGWSGRTRFRCSGTSKADSRSGVISGSRRRGRAGPRSRSLRHCRAERRAGRARRAGGAMSHSRIFGVLLVIFSLAARGEPVLSQQQPFQFHLVEATIADVHRGIQTGQLTCRALVQAYINRAKAYNGTCNQLVTEEMAPKFLPDYATYAAAVKATADLPPGDPRKTPPIEFGRMEPTSSDPSVQQQYGMTVGIPNAGQVRAL